MSIIKTFGTRGCRDDQLGNPRFMTIDKANGNIVINSWGGYVQSSIKTFDCNGNFIIQFNAPISTKYIAINLSSQYVLSNGIYTMNGEIIQQNDKGDICGFTNNHCMLRLINNSTAIITDGNKVIHKFTPRGIPHIPSRGNPNKNTFTQILSFIQDNKGNYLILDNGMHNLHVFSSDYSFKRIIGSYGDLPDQFINPSCLAVDNDNNYLIGCENGIKVMSCKGDYITTIDIIQPISIAVNREGNYVILTDKCVHIYSPFVEKVSKTVVPTNPNLFDDLMKSDDLIKFEEPDMISKQLYEQDCNEYTMFGNNKIKEDVASNKFAIKQFAEKFDMLCDMMKEQQAYYDGGKKRIDILFTMMKEQHRVCEENTKKVESLIRSNEERIIWMENEISRIALVIEKRKPKKAIPATIKRLVWNKYIGESVGKGKCCCCNITEITQLSFHCGHVVSEYNGGEITIENLRPICQNCNSSMGKKNMKEFIEEHGIWSR